MRSVTAFFVSVLVALKTWCALLPPCDLSVERRVDPIGIDVSSPRFAWELPADVREQSAYEIEIDGCSFGKVLSPGQTDREISRRDWVSGSRHAWRVRFWDDDGEVSEWSAPARFTMGVMTPTDWRAKWIGPNPVTRPEVDFGSARWVTSDAGTVGFDFELAEVPSVLELVFLSRSPYDLYVNGRKSRCSCKSQDWSLRFVKFLDLVSDDLVAGVNRIEFRRQKKEEPLAVIAQMRVNGVPNGIVSSASWAGVRELGGLRDVPWCADPVLGEELVSPAFEKRFTARAPVAKATLFITGLGFYEASLNGMRVGDKVLDPSPTDYTKRVLYSTYELDGCVRQGDNVLRVLVGHGFYDVRVISPWDNDMATWRDSPRMIAQLELEYDDGSHETIVSDETWRQVKGPVGWDDIREGEVVGGRHVREPEFPADGFPVAVVDAPRGRLQAERQPPSRVLYTNRPRRIKPVAGEPGAYMVEFPENIAGWVRLKLRDLRTGDVVVVRYDEHKDGDLEPAVADEYYRRQGVSTLNNGGRVEGVTPRRVDCHAQGLGSGNVCPVGRGFQTDRFVAGADGAATYEPRFSWNGFQYVLVKGLRSPLTADDIEQCVVSTDFPETGTFESSDPILDRLVRAAARTYRANFTNGFPTDCPHREKNGWTGDAAVACTFAQYRFENTSAYEKWIGDLVDAQAASGDIPAIVPSPRWGFAWGNGPAWDIALAHVPWTLWRYRDDRRAIETAYPALVKYLSFTATKEDAEGLVSHGLGDWISPRGVKRPAVAFTSSCHYLQATEIGAAMARVLGKPDEASRLSEKAAHIRAAIRKRFLRADGTVDNGGQTAQSCALAFGIVDPAERPAVEAKMIAAVRAHGDVIETGLIGMKTIFRALSEAGRGDLALKLLLRPQAPSPAAWMHQGSETFWEDWDEGASRNHIMFGDTMAWVYEYVLGVRLADGVNAFRRFRVCPGWTCGLEYASGSVETPYGRIAVLWRCDGSATVDVPSGTSCDFVGRDGALHRLPPGVHRIDATIGR